MTRTADTDIAVRRKALAAATAGSTPDHRDLAALTRLYVRDGTVVDGGLVCGLLGQCMKVDGGAAALRAAQGVLAGLATQQGTTHSPMAMQRVGFLKERVESELEPMRALPGVATLLLLLFADSRLRDEPGPAANWKGLAYRLATAGKPGEGGAVDQAAHPALLRRDAFALAWEPAVTRGEELKLAERILDAPSWPLRGRAAMIRRLWQTARRPWEQDAPINLTTTGVS